MMMMTMLMTMMMTMIMMMTMLRKMIMKTKPGRQGWTAFVGFEATSCAHHDDALLSVHRHHQQQQAPTCSLPNPRRTSAPPTSHCPTLAPYLTRDRPAKYRRAQSQSREGTLSQTESRDATSG